MVKPQAMAPEGKSLLLALFLLLVTVWALLPGVGRSVPEQDGPVVTVATAEVAPTPTNSPDSNSWILDETPVDTVVQDATGAIWGVNTWGKDAFYRWNGKKWASSPFKEVVGAAPIALQRVQDGAVLCLWRFDAGDKPVKELLLSEHKGNSSRVIAHWQGEFYSDIRLYRSRQATWITVNGIHIYRVQNGTAKSVYDITKSQMHSGHPKVPPGWKEYNALELVEDGRGHTWFWSNEYSGAFNNLSLRGLLEFDGKKWTHHVHLPGVVDKPLAAFTRRDGRHFWLAVGDVGLYEFDVQALRGQRVTDPVPHAFEIVQNIQQVSGIWYVISHAPEARYPGGDYSLRDSDLWRWSPSSTLALQQGHFERILRGLDRGKSSSHRATRPLLATAHGL